MSEFLMKPKVDFAFKEIMMDDEARIGFLSAMLKLDPCEIRETQILNPDLGKQQEHEKQGIVDVRILMNNEAEIDIEIQLSPLHVWTDRALFYLSKMYIEQIRAGKDYTVFKRCVSISILDFDLFKGEKEFYSCFHILEDTRHFRYTDKMEFHVLELPKLPEELKEGSSDILLWARFLNAERKEEFDMLAGKNEYIGSAYHHLQVISQDEGKRREYEAREKALRDYNQGILEAEQRGREKAMRDYNQGILEAEQRGREKALRDYNQGILKAEQRGEARGRTEGQLEGAEEAVLVSIRSLMETLHLTADQAMAALKVPQENCQKYREKLARD